MEPNPPSILSILVCDGPAPGINDVIAAATIRALDLGWTVYGFQDGFRHLASGNINEIRENVIELTRELVQPIMRTGGSFLRTDRYDPTSNQDIINEVLKILIEDFHTKYLLIICGNSKIACTHLITKGVDPDEIQVIVVPKTIDNDIMLPEKQDCFGFNSAHLLGAQVVSNLINESKSYPKWFIIETMGRHTGHIALSIANATGAELSIIPEDFTQGKQLELSEICDICEGAIIKRYAEGFSNGVIIIAEGILDLLTNHALQTLLKGGFIQYNENHQIAYDDTDLARAIAHELQNRIRKIELDLNITPKQIGYEMRSCTPNDVDAVYGQRLGHGAIEGFLGYHSNCIVEWDGENVSYVSFRDISDPKSGQIMYRHVNVHSQNYLISKHFMWNIKEEDINNQAVVSKLSQILKMKPEDFIKKFGNVNNFIRK